MEIGVANCLAVEARGMAILSKFLRDHASQEGQYVVIDKGPLAKSLQETIGDILYNRKRDAGLRSAEIKIEQDFTGNLFLETWSNYVFESVDRRAAHPPNPGWMFKSNADYLWYYFLDRDYLFVCNLIALQQWAFGKIESVGGKSRLVNQNLFKYREVAQGRTVQSNRSFGRLVPIETLQATTIPIKILHPRALINEK